MRKKCRFLFCVAAALIASAQQPPPRGGARIETPFQQAIAGGQCFVGSGKNTGDVAFGFPSRGLDQALAFTIGPLRDGFSPGQENNKPYSGPATYSHVGFFVKSANGKILSGFGTVTVNTDEQTGTFAFQTKGGKVSGSWDCGTKLKH